jgi:tetratricopeptide (TPR) repeat protein
MTLSKCFRALVLASGLVLAPALQLAPAQAVDNAGSNSDIDLTSVRTKIEKQDYASALTELRALSEDSQNADVYNLLGFTLRKTGDMTTALSYYTRALELQPDHKGAHEYLGELYLETGKLDKAKEQLDILAKLCPNGCEERADLEKAIGANSASN